jgi:tRNA nucleotidyltransferase (CCA-adding enzyme)
MRILLAGGSVRDRLLGRPVRDRDFLVLDAGPQEFARRFPKAKPVGKAFPVFILDGEEYAFPRGDGAGDPDGGLARDLRLRDFTVNALAQEEGPDGAVTLHAHPLALEDLRNRVLRPASERSIPDDPLRVFRAARFLAELPEFTAHPELMEALRAAAASGLLGQVTGDRVGAELRKALRVPRPGRFLELLDRAGCLSPWFVELERASSIPAGPAPFHHTHVLGHTMEVMDRVAALVAEGNVPAQDQDSGGSQGKAPASDPERPQPGEAQPPGGRPDRELAVYLALAHDLGKTLTPESEWPRHIGHEKRGRALALALGERLRLPSAFIRAGEMAARWHMTAARYPELRPGTRVDLLLALHLAGLTREMFALARADHDSGPEVAPVVWREADHQADQGSDQAARQPQDPEHAPARPSISASGQHDARLEQALAETHTILQVTLEPEDRNQGEASGRKLRDLRAQALARPPYRP